MEHVQTELSSWRTMNCSRPLEVTDPTNQTFYWCLQMESPLAVTNHSLKLFHHSRYVVSFPPYNLQLFWSAQASYPTADSCLSILCPFGLFTHSLTHSHTLVRSLVRSFVRSAFLSAYLFRPPSVSHSVHLCVSGFVWFSVQKQTNKQTSSNFFLFSLEI